MADGTVVLRVDADGVVRAASEAAGRVLGPVVGRRCAEVVGAVARDGERVCSGACAAALGARPDGHRAEPGVVVGGRVSELACTAVGDETIVTLRPGRWSAEAFPARLTPREREVVAAIAAGQTNKQIGLALGLQPATVRTHIEHVLAKLGASSRAEAASLARELGELPSG
jgi:DNA-binding NarL/FixJ family response regulator